jgi:hypothetical protein
MYFEFLGVYVTTNDQSLVEYAPQPTLCALLLELVALRQHLLVKLLVAKSFILKRRWTDSIESYKCKV